MPEAKTSRIRDAARTKADILRAAQAEFVRHGLAGARIDRIAKKAGCNKQLIYSYVGNKMELFQALMAERLVEMEVFNEDRPDDPAEAAALQVAFHSEHQDLMRLAMWEVLSLDEPIETEKRQAMLQRYVDDIKQDIDDGNYPADTNAEQLALTLIGSMIYPILMPYITEMLTGEKPDSQKFITERQEHMRQFVEVLRAGAKAIAAEQTS